MIFKLLIDPDYEKAQTSANTVMSHGIKITDELIVPVSNSKGEVLKEVRCFVCDGTQDQLDTLCKEYDLEFKQEYEGAPLYY